MVAHDQPDSQPWLSLKASAAYLDVDERTIKNYVAASILPAYRLAGRRKIMLRRVDLDALMQPITTGAAAS